VDPTRRSTCAVVGVPAAFALGCLPSARIVARLVGGAGVVAAGDGKPGAANVARTLGRGPGAVTLAADLLKGAAPAVLARRCGVGPGLTGAVAIAPVFGHVSVVGGRGAATALGAALAIDVPATGVVLPAVVGGALARHAALGVMVAALGLPLASLALGRRGRAAWCATLPVILACARLRGDRGAGPLTARVAWERFWYDREPGGVGDRDGVAPAAEGTARAGAATAAPVAGRTADDPSRSEEAR
jgi:glycerol-3-phosphate acyltransferase PlsY